MRSRRFFALVALLGFSLAAAADDLSVPPYQATYSAGLDGFRVGKAEISLSRNGDGSYSYRSVITPSGLASLFVSDTVTESSRFEINAGAPRSLQYGFSQSGGSHEKSETIQFDWDKMSAETEEDKRQQSTALGAGVCDRFLAQLLLSLDTAAGRLPASYQILDHREINAYTPLAQNKGSLQTEAGEFQDLTVVELRDGKRNRVTRFWLAPQLHFLPVEIEQIEPGKSGVKLALTSISFNPAAAPAATSKPSPPVAGQESEQK